MTAYHIISYGTITATNLPSRWDAGVLFQLGTGTGNSLTVDDGAFLHSTSVQTVWLNENTTAWTVTVNGQIISENDNAIWLRSNTLLPAKQSKITVGLEGSLSSNHAGDSYQTVYAQQALALTNYGTIINRAGGAIDYTDSGVSSLVNSGTITANGGFNAVSAYYASAFSLTNSGSINGNVQIGSAVTVTSTVTISTTGVIYGTITTGAGNDKLTIGAKGATYDVDLGGGNNTIDAQGGIGGNVTTGAGNDNVKIGVAGSAHVVNLGEGTNIFSDAGFMYADNNVVSYYGSTTNDTITISKTGSLGAVEAYGGKNSLTNDGDISSTADHWVSYDGGDGDDTVKNTGTLLGGVWVHNGNNSLTNSGTVKADKDGYSYVGGTGTDTVTNSKGGSLTGGVKLSDLVHPTADGTNSLTNDGTVGAANYVSYIGGSYKDTIKNTGTMDGAIHAFGGSNSLTNSGYIGYDPSADSYVGGADDDTVTNTGRMPGVVDLGGGVNILHNNGDAAFIGFVTGGDGKDTITNSGTIEGGLNLKGGNDSLTNTGHALGIIDMGAGDDYFSGGAFGVSMYDNSGKDTYKFGSGDDIYHAYYDGTSDPNFDGADLVDGGGGNNTYTLLDAPDTLVININLDNQQHSGVVFSSSSLAKTTATVDLGNHNVDTVLNFHNIQMGFGGGLAIGTASAENMTANGGVTELDGLGGNDTLKGAYEGLNYLVGGAGADQLYGGAGPNEFTYFIYTSTSDSGLTTATRDVIHDFIKGQDKIDLSRIDANTKMADTQHFNVLLTDAMFSGHAGELQIVTTATGERLSGDTDGDGKANFQIDIADANHALYDSTHHTYLSLSDFILS